MDGNVKGGIDKREAGAAAEATRCEPHYSPPVDILETESELVLVAEMAGVARDDVDVDLEKGVLTITGRMRPRRLDESFRPLAAEYERGHFSRSFALAEEIDSEKIEATMSRGVLRVRLPKSSAARARRIAVKGA